jgi:polysaccharide pyruvyl transferase WcaK-like protein
MSINKKKFILANVTLQTGNKGCVALCYSMMYLIDVIMSEKNIDYQLYLTESNERSGHHELTIGGRNIAYESVDNAWPISWRKAYLLLTNFKKNYRLYKLYKDADCIMDIGQGDSFADIYGNKRFAKIDKVHRLARLFRKPYFFLPQTIGPFQNPTIREKAVKSINKAEIVMTRDRQSLDYVNELTNRKAHVKEYIDVAFFLPYNKIEFNKNEVHVGLNISGLLWNGGYTRNNQFGLKADYQHVIRNIISFFLSNEGVRLHLISHVASGTRNVESDYAVLYDLWREYHSEQMTLAPFFHSPIEAKDYIAGLDFFMGARMHATIAAFSAGVPVLPMVYSRKFNGLFVDTLAYDHLADLKADDESTILTKVENCFALRDSLRQEIADQLASTVSEQKEKLLVDLTAQLSQ